MRSPTSTPDAARRDLAAAGGSGYAGTARPVVIFQDDRFEATPSVTVCSFTTDPTDATLFRLLIEPAAGNSLEAPSRLMVDKITTIPRTKLGRHIGRVGTGEVARLDRAIAVFLGLARAAAPVRR